jgi:multidrug resistance efflux pump
LRRRRAPLAALVLALLAAAAWAAFSRDEETAWAAVERGDLVLGVEVSGALRAADSQLVGPPPVAHLWQFKISMLAPEGAQVRAGQPVVAFDASELERQLETFRAESEGAGKELEKRRAELAVEGHDAGLRLAEAQARLRRAELKASVPAELAAARELEDARLDRELARREVASLEERATRARAAGEAELESLRETRDRAAGRVRELEAAIARMTVPAPADGTVIYVSSRRDEKKKVGDTCWMGEKVLEIPDLRRMYGEGEVEEADAGRLRVGMPVRLRLDAHPDREFTGRVEALARTVQRQSPQTPRKVARLRVALDSTDTERMRPGMRFRGEIEVERVDGSLLVPLAAVVPDAAGPLVYRRRALGVEPARVRLGRRDARAAEVLAGLERGDRVALDPAARGGAR